MEKIVYKKDIFGKCIVFAGIYREEPLFCDRADRNVRQRYHARICVQEIYRRSHSHRSDQSIPTAGADQGVDKLIFCRQNHGNVFFAGWQRCPGENAEDFIILETIMK